MAVSAGAMGTLVREASLWHLDGRIPGVDSRSEMCGIVGFVEHLPRGTQAARRLAEDMCRTVAHRGPDGEGVFVDLDGKIALGHRRLSIIDLSELGAQPMSSPSGRYEIVFNGEIYGFHELARGLSECGVKFRGYSDTEVFLGAIDMYGIEGALKRVGGMFAFAVFDRQERTLVLARDRIGKKPLYIGVQNGALVFGSELKALRRHPSFELSELNQSGLSLYLKYGYIPSPHTIYEGVVKLPPGHWVEVSADEALPSARALVDRASAFWSAREVAADGVHSRLKEEPDALALLDKNLRAAVAERMISDVPLGAFLSGGIDSSLVCALMQEQSETKVRTFTIRFLEADRNEADEAAAVAAHLGTDHSELTATADSALELLEELPTVFDEPFADPSQVPTLLVSRLARQHVTVALSGDGGDESFGGYRHYKLMTQFEALRKLFPTAMWERVADGRLPLLERGLLAGRQILPLHFRKEVSADRLRKLARIMLQPEFRSRVQMFVSLWNDDLNLMYGGGETASHYTGTELPEGLDPVEQMMLIDTLMYLPDDVMTKVDRCSMAEGLEMRAPLLDHRVVAAAWRLPKSLRINRSHGKVALRKLLARRMPVELFDRPKRGFGVPMNDWLRGPLRDRAAEVLSPSRLSDLGLDAAVGDRRWAEHLAGKRNWGASIWSLLVYDAWHKRWMRTPRFSC